MTLSVLNWYLSRLSVPPASTRRMSYASSLWSCSVSSFPWTETTSMLHSTPSNPWRIWLIFFWNFSEPELIPKGNTLVLKTLWSLPIFRELCLLLGVDGSPSWRTHSACLGRRRPWPCHCFLGSPPWEPTNQWVSQLWIWLLSPTFSPTLL